MSILAVTRTGEGPPLVLVHGYFGGAGHWTAQIAYFSGQYDVIAPSLAGFGDSATLTAPDSIAEHAAMVWDTLDALGVSRIRLLGHSMGGMVVQQMTAQAPERVERLVLYGTGPVGKLPGRFETLDESRARLHREGTEAVMRRIAATWLVEGEAAPGYAACVKEGLKATDQAALASLTAWEGWDGRPALATITAPTLVIWGDQDRSYPRAQADALAEGIPGARLVVVPGCAHAVHLEQPEIFHAEVGAFIHGSD